MHRCLRLAVCAVTFVIFAASLGAQTLVGTWQGTLASGPGPRVILDVVKLPDGTLHATIFRPDTSGLAGLPFSTVRVEGKHVDLAIDGTGASLSADFDADGKSLTGTWIDYRGKPSQPLTLHLAAPADRWLKRPTNRMDPHADPSYEVASIHLSPPGSNDFLWKPRNHVFRERGWTAKMLLGFAYGLQERQIEGLPAWASEQHFDITAEADTPGDPVEDQTRVMLRKLFADRFALKAHTVQKDFPIYALKVEKTSAKITPSTEMEGDHSNMSFFRAADDHFQANMTATTLSEFAELLMHFFPDKQVVDRTGLTGRWDFRFELTGDIVGPNRDSGEMQAAFFRGLSTIGLKLEPARAPLDVLIVDHIEKPTDN